MERNKRGSEGDRSDKPSRRGDRDGSYRGDADLPSLGRGDDDVTSSAQTTGVRRRRDDPLAETAAFFDEFAHVEDRWERRTRSYRRLVTRIFGFLVPEGSSVLELGCGSGDLLAALRPSRGVGIDISGEMIARARARHDELELHVASAETFLMDATFDYIVISDLVPFVDDLLALLFNAREMSHERTRLVLHTHSQLWRPDLALAELVRLKPRKPIRNWVGPADLRNLLELAGFEIVTTSRRILFPIHVPVVSSFLNGFLANLWPFTHLCLSYWVIARPQPKAGRAHTVSVVVPCRNEAGTIEEIIERVPEMGAGRTEIIFVEGHSADDTRSRIECAIAAHPERDLKLHIQSGTGKANAVREGFDLASGDLLMILDGDLTVAPEVLPNFYEAVASGRAELANGSRLVYDLEAGAMQFLNILGNKFFSAIFSYLLGQPVKDTLCGTKALLRRDQDAIARGRWWFGDFDPFGDFDLLLGAGRLSLKIADLPVRYGRRTYGSTNISRVRHGVLLARMCIVGFRALKFWPNVRA